MYNKINCYNVYFEKKMQLTTTTLICVCVCIYILIKKNTLTTKSKKIT